MFAVNWEQVKDDFAWDGSLRAVYVLDTHVDEWELFFEVLREAGYSLTYSIDSETRALPARAEEALHLRALANPVLEVSVDGITIACHFLREEEIELEFDARDVNEDRLPALLAFVSGLGDRLLKDVQLTRYKRPDAPFLRYSWQDCRMELLPATA